MPSEFKYIPDGLGAYRVEIRRTGREVGTIRKYEQHYNLARPFTVRGWTATAGDGALGREEKPNVYSTREKAARALEEATSMEAKIEIGGNVGIFFEDREQDELGLSGRIARVHEIFLHKNTVHAKIPDGPLVEIPIRYLVSPHEARTRVPEPDDRALVIPRLKHIRGHIDRAIELADDYGVPRANLGEFIKELDRAFEELSADLHHMTKDPDVAIMLAIADRERSRTDEQDEPGEAPGEEAQEPGEEDQEGDEHG